MMPPSPNHFHAIGEVQVANPGIEALLTLKEPQGVNPAVLLLDLHLVQKPGVWPQIVTWIQARYDKTMTPNTPRYTQAQVFEQGASLATVPVHTVE
jgi:hypothetical protein